MKRIAVDRTLLTAGAGLLLMSVGAALALLPALGLVIFGAGLLAYAVFLAPDQNGGPTP